MCAAMFAFYLVVGYLLLASHPTPTVSICMVALLHLLLRPR